MMTQNHARSNERPRIVVRSERRGFALLGVVLILALITTVIAISLDGATQSTQNAGRIRAAEMVKSGLDQGLSQAIEKLQGLDPASISTGTQFDIFDATGTPAFLIPPMPYPPAGPYSGQYVVHVGMVPGQVTRAPVGEDVRSAAGQIYEIQVSVEAQGSGISPSMERVSIGVLLSRRSAY